MVTAIAKIFESISPSLDVPLEEVKTTKAKYGIK